MEKMTFDLHLTPIDVKYFAPRPDEYLDGGLPHCKKCKGARYTAIQGDNGEIHLFRTLCNCQKVANDKIRAEEERQAELAFFKWQQGKAGVPNRYFDASLVNTIIDKTQGVFISCDNYIKNAKLCFEQNLGLYFYGSNSSGKTYLTVLLCNELIKLGYKCYFTSIAQEISTIQKAFGSGEDKLSGIISDMQYYDFVFFDDIGKESIGDRKSAYNSRIMYEIINARYNAQKPTIFSSNYSLNDLIAVLGIDRATVERITEMSVKTIKLEDKNYRKEIRAQKQDFLKKIGI